MTRPGWPAAAVLTAALGLSLATAMASPPEDRFAEAGDLRLHSLDFGGEGLPILLVHSGDRGARTWQEFAPRFTDRHRVLAITARGVGESGGEPGDAETRGRDFLAFLDALDIEPAVLIGNSSPAQEMTWLAEHYPERLSGLIYLANAPWPAGIEQENPTGTLAMANAVLGEPEAYRPEYLRSERKEIGVPALTFVAEELGPKIRARRPGWAVLLAAGIRLTELRR